MCVPTAAAAGLTTTAAKPGVHQSRQVGQYFCFLKQQFDTSKYSIYETECKIKRAQYILG
jgi:hypothetical protein